MSERKQRLFAVACCRLVWGLLGDQRSRRAVVIAERVAAGRAAPEQLIRARRAARRAAQEVKNRGRHAEAAAANAAVRAVLPSAEATTRADTWARLALREQGGDLQQIHQTVRCLNRCIRGQPPYVNQDWLTWNGGLVRKLARAIHAGRDFAQLPVLGDALEEAGCTNPDILDHCRSHAHHDRGCRVLDALLGLDAGWADLHLLPARQHFQAGNLDAAIACFDQALGAFPSQPIDAKLAWAYACRAEAYRQKGHLDQAVADATAALRLDPNNSFACTVRADACWPLGDFDQSMADRDRAAQLGPIMPWALTQRSEFWWENDDFDRAVTDATAALQVTPDDVAALRIRGDSYRVKGELERALADLDRAVQLEPDCSWNHAARAGAHWKLRNYHRAIADCDAALHLTPNDAFAWGVRGDCYRQLGELETALASLDRAVGLAQNSEWIEEMRSALHWEMQGLCTERPAANVEPAPVEPAPKRWWFF